MKFFRNVLHDLVEKRLWPVAVALIVALVAVPVVLGGKSGSGSDTSAATAAVPPAPTGAGGARATAAQVVSLEDQAAGKVDRSGKTRNPFVQHHMPKPVDDSVKQALSGAKSLVGGLGSAAPTPSSSSASGAGGSTPATNDVNPGAPGTTVTSPTTPKSSKATYRVTLSFGEEGAQKTYNNLARLTPLPSSDNPFFVFLGVKSDGKSAVFLVDSSAVPSGDGKCEPSDSECSQIVLKKGDLEFFELQSGTAGVVQYMMEIKDISKGKAATTASAAAAHARESQAGREYIRQLLADQPDALSDWNYDRGLGVLVSKEPEVANVPSGVAAEAAGEPVQNTATVLTVPAAPQP